MRQLVDQRHLWCAGQHRVEVKLAEGRSAILDLSWWKDLQALHLLRRVGTPVSFAEADDDIGSALEPAVGLAEHGDGLANPWCGTKVDAQSSACHVRFWPLCPCRAGRQTGRTSAGGCEGGAHLVSEQNRHPELDVGWVHHAGRGRQQELTVD